MPAPSRGRSQAWPILFGLAAVCWVMTACFAMIAVRFQGVADAARAWPTTTGTVVRSRIVAVDHRDPDDGVVRPHDDLDLAYTYAVDGRSYEGHKYDATAGLDAGDLQRVVAEHPVGAEVQVHYDPETPANSGLRVGESNIVGPFELVAALTGAVGLVLAAFGVRSLLRSRGTE